jgi:hypothetical protein
MASWMASLLAVKKRPFFAEAEGLGVSGLTEVPCLAWGACEFLLTAGCVSTSVAGEGCVFRPDEDGLGGAATGGSARPS